MDARVNEVILPLAARVMEPTQAKRASAEGYLATTVMHENLSRTGAGVRARERKERIRFANRSAERFPRSRRRRPTSSGCSRCDGSSIKAVLPKERLEEYYASELAGIFRHRADSAPARHTDAPEMMEFNYYSEQGAIVKANGRYRVEYTKIGAATARLAKELLEQERPVTAPGRRRGSVKYDKMPTDLKAQFAARKDVPVDVDPIFSLTVKSVE
jgi:hypothetical protein